MTNACATAGFFNICCPNRSVLKSGLFVALPPPLFSVLSFAAALCFDRLAPVIWMVDEVLVDFAAAW
jgi:hypothetical protein